MTIRWGSVSSQLIPYTGYKEFYNKVGRPKRYTIAVYITLFTTKYAGPDWLRTFMSRWSELSLGSPEATSLARATAFNQHNVSFLLLYEKF